ncbi:hypothetical protein [Pseudomonas sp. RT6P73]
MKRSDDPTGLQILVTGAIAIAMLVHAIYIFVYRVYTQRPEQHQEGEE